MKRVGFLRKGHLSENSSTARVVNGMRVGLDRQMTDIGDSVTKLESVKLPFFDGANVTHTSPASFTVTSAYTAISSYTFDRTKFSGCDSFWILGVVSCDLAVTGVFDFAILADGGSVTLAEMPHLEMTHAMHLPIALTGVWKPPSGSSLKLGMYVKRSSGTGNLTYSYLGITIAGGYS
jgi:hypothetical protein